MRPIARPKASIAAKPASKRASARRKRSFFRQTITILGGVIFLGIAASGVWLYHAIQPGKMLSAWFNARAASFFALTAKSGLTLKHIFIEGKRHAPSEALVAALDVKLGQPLLAIPLQEIKIRLEEIDWVKYATVDRVFPGDLFVQIVERKPLAIWQKAGKLYLVDDEGVMIEEKDLKPFSSLLILVGDDAPLYARNLLDIIQKDPELYKQITAAVRVGERRWNIRFASGLEIKLPEENTEEAWRYVMKLQQEKKLFSPTVTSIDLRIAGKVYVK